MDGDLNQTVDALSERFIAINPISAAHQLELHDPSDISEILSGYSPTATVPVWEALPPGISDAAFAFLPHQYAVDIANSIDAVLAASILSRVSEAQREAVLADLSKDKAWELGQLMAYPPSTAGSMMDPRVLAFHPTTTVDEAIPILRARGRRENHELYIVDEKSQLKGAVDIKYLVLSAGSQKLEEIAQPVTAVIQALDPRDDVVEKFELSKLPELPVIDSASKLVGVVRHSELVDAVRQDATADMVTMVGGSRDERATSTSWFAIRKRLPWLQINLLTAFMAAAVVGLFEGTIAKFTALAVLLPVVAGQSGNAGSQALAVTMRGLALREIRVRQWMSVLRKEVNTGFWNGIGIAVTCGIGVFIWSQQIGLVIVIMSSMIIAMVAAGMAGALVPIVLSRLGQDPAVASSIILTTVTDIAGFMSFLGIATLLSGMLS